MDDLVTLGEHDESTSDFFSDSSGWSEISEEETEDMRFERIFSWFG